MGKLGEEVSQKIKSAIKAKLMELGIHIDNELPDYVMVLVANKKTQQQMEDDLSLFLGDSTRAFTSWLHNVLKKLEQVTISTKAKKKDKLRKRGHDSNGVSSSKKLKTEPEEVKTEPEETIAPEPVETEIPLKTVASSVTEDTENDDALSLTDNTDVRNEPESTSKEISVDRDGEEIKRDEEILDETRPRERIKIVWDKDGESSTDKVTKSQKERDKSSRKMERGREKDRQSRSRSRSRSRNRYSSRKKRENEEETSDRSKRRSRSQDRFSRRQSTSPNRLNSGDRKVVDARDILKRRGADKKLSEAKPKRMEMSPYRRRNRSKSREPRENKMSSVLKAVIRAPEKPPPSIPSLVKVTPRPVRPPSMQPNCNLILKAVADAEKSLANSKVNTKKKEEYTEKRKKRDRKNYEYAAKGNISITLLNDRVVASKLDVPSDAYPKDDEESEGNIENNENQTSQETLVEEDALSMALDADDYIDSLDKEEHYVAEPLVPTLEEYKPTPKGKDRVDKKKRFIISLDSTASDNEGDNELDSARPNYEISDDVTSTTVEPVFEDKNEKHHFDRSRLGPKVQLSPTSPTGSGKRSAIPETLAELTASITRCKYWPNCDAGDGCPYVHPSSLCRSFPSCRFGDKCLYIHPGCKFADNCLNAKCPYTHTSKTPVAKAPRPYLPISNPQATCMYYPNCTKAYCPYLHPKKACRFGATCTKFGCDFDHGNSNRNPYKWVATNTI